MRTLRYLAPAHHVLRVGDQQVNGGEDFEVTNQVADELLTAPYANVALVEDDEPEAESGEGQDTNPSKED